ncbi:hypothetical protein DICVIV_04367 [Dictyocaulus viviparus]|uniref:Globin n=1 Tax=Dictyocaulus viviparus TaxID=29172 RepID=A0A0D8XXV4_DICVI|nr:hypothetical protein DICVIV_04367 [Dictyocaulus viviparus]
MSVTDEKQDEPEASQNTVIITPSEKRYLKLSWEKIPYLLNKCFRASNAVDIGCELVAALLNDNRTRFRAFIQSHTNDVLGTATFTAEDVRKYERALAVANGVVVFFNKLISKLDEPNCAELIALQSQHLGASHFRMKVWFQAENWLCVKNCLLSTIMKGLTQKSESQLTSNKSNYKGINLNPYELILYIAKKISDSNEEALTVDGSSGKTPVS